MLAIAARSLGDFKKQAKRLYPLRSAERATQNSPKNRPQGELKMARRCVAPRSPVTKDMLPVAALGAHILNSTIDKSYGYTTPASSDYSRTLGDLAHEFLAQDIIAIDRAGFPVGMSLRISTTSKCIVRKNYTSCSMRRTGLTFRPLKLPEHRPLRKRPSLCPDGCDSRKKAQTSSEIPQRSVLATSSRSSGLRARRRRLDRRRSMISIPATLNEFGNGRAHICRAPCG